MTLEQRRNNEALQQSREPYEEFTKMRSMPTGLSPVGSRSNWRRRDVRIAVETMRTQPRNVFRRVAKEFLVQGARARMDCLPARELVSLAGREVLATLASPSSRHAWSLGAAEQVAIQALVRHRGVRTAFEIGTFNGATSALIAESLPEDGEIVTVDLPEDSFDATQNPDGFAGGDVGRVHRESPAAHKVTQVRADSLMLDVTPWESWADLVLVDGAHDYEHGYADTVTALRVVRPGGLVLWDDFDPYWHGLVHGILDAVEPRPICRLAGMPMAVLLSESGEA